MTRLTLTRLLTIMLATSILHGCAAVSALPSMQHCQRLKYERAGTAVKLDADCTAPVGGPGL